MAGMALMLHCRGAAGRLPRSRAAQGAFQPSDASLEGGTAGA